MSLVNSVIDGRMRPSTPYSRWTEVANTRYTATPASTSSITMSDTAGMAVGLPVRYRLVDGSLLYGVIIAVAPDALISVAGAPLSADISRLDLGLPDQIAIIPISILGAFATNDTSTLLLNNGLFARWNNGPAFIVSFSIRQRFNDDTSQPRINVLAGGLLVSTDNGNDGPALGIGVWVNNGAVSINTTNYALTNREDFELKLTKTGGTENSADLAVEIVVVYED